MGSGLVVKANKLIEARYELSLLEQKIILYAITKLDREQGQFNVISLELSEFMELIGTTGERYTEIREVVTKLMSKQVRIKAEGRDLVANWVSSIEYIEGNGTVEIEFSVKLTPYLLQLKNKFTRYQLKNILYLKNKYSIRIYELLKAFEGLGKKDFTLEELKQILSCEDSYADFRNFDRLVLSKTKQEINQHTDLDIDYEKVKRGRKVTGIRYSIQNKDSQYIRYLDQTYDIADIRSRSGLGAENWNSKQIMELYTIACQKTVNEEIDVFEYIRLNYMQMLQNESVRNGFAYLKKALENDYAVAVGQIKMGYEVDLAL